ncbi:hypothetical protein [Acinetobacter sp. TGL-Y2]|uniref:hypothetical protein n=1 Tax=Acinetobacter sp. TGL-Y2 TaxID=1407071 RepID=UPI001907F478|nr:hypothetical protein [Acinetobacter sp. TGL-Y2]MBJ9370921.1 hypothetical protein [Acinetobacter sp. TGL-Y2]
MKKENNLSKKINNAILAVILFTFISFILIYGLINNSKNTDLKDSVSLAISFSSVLATLSAAYIASLLFNRWQDQHNKTVDKEISFGIIASLNAFLLSTQHFYNSYTQAINSLRAKNYQIEGKLFMEFLEYLRKLILDHEHSLTQVANEFSDLAGVMQEEEYQQFNKEFLTILQATQLLHQEFINQINNLKTMQNNMQILKGTCDLFENSLDFLTLSDGGAIDRIKSIKYELAKFYRA